MRVVYVLTSAIKCFVSVLASLLLCEQSLLILWLKLGADTKLATARNLERRVDRARQCTTAVNAAHLVKYFGENPLVAIADASTLDNAATAQLPLPAAREELTLVEIVAAVAAPCEGRGAATRRHGLAELDALAALHEQAPAPVRNG